MGVAFPYTLPSLYPSLAPHVHRTIQPTDYSLCQDESSELLEKLESKLAAKCLELQEQQEEADRQARQLRDQVEREASRHLDEKRRAEEDVVREVPADVHPACMLPPTGCVTISDGDDADADVVDVPGFRNAFTAVRSSEHYCSSFIRVARSFTACSFARAICRLRLPFSALRN